MAVIVRHDDFAGIAGLDLLAADYEGNFDLNGALPLNLRDKRFRFMTAWRIAPGRFVLGRVELENSVIQIKYLLLVNAIKLHLLNYITNTQRYYSNHRQNFGAEPQGFACGLRISLIF
jgi:hypothetical protein